MNNSLKSKLVNFQLAVLSAFTYTSLAAYGYKDGDWLHRANTGTDSTGIFVRVLAVSGVNKLYAFIASNTSDLHFVPASQLKSVDYKSSYKTTGFGLPTDFVTNVFEETAPTGYVLDADKKVVTISSVATTPNDIPDKSTLETQIPTPGNMRVPTTAGLIIYAGYGNSATALSGKTKVALAGEVPTSIVKQDTTGDSGKDDRNFWQKLSPGWRTTIIISAVVIVVIIILKVLPAPRR
jgi:hypothetical protein